MPYSAVTRSRWRLLVVLYSYSDMNNWCSLSLCKRDHSSAVSGNHPLPRHVFPERVVDCGEIHAIAPPHTHVGRDQERKHLVAPYPHGAFDILVVVWKEGDGPLHFWRIPTAELTARGYLSTPTHVGKMTLIVHGPVGQQPDSLARNKADTWTRAFYVNS